jgi:hypothetical protein
MSRLATAGTVEPQAKRNEPRFRGATPFLGLVHDLGHAEALQLAAVQDKETLAKSIQAKIQLYQSQTPFRETP